MVGSSMFLSLPKDLISEVLARVGSSSIPDLCSCNLSCKTFKEIGKNKYVIQRLDIRELDPLYTNCHHWGEALSFFHLCVDSDHPEALFIQGMHLYFSQVNIQEGVGNLERATSLGHKTAAYVLGLILICCGSGDSMSRGMDLIKWVKTSAGKRIVECRQRVQELIHKIWVNIKLSYEWTPMSCTREFSVHGRCQRRRNWRVDEYLLEDDDDALFCGNCSCEQECKFFLSLFHLPM